LERHFEGHLEKLKMRLLRMGGLAEQAVHLSMKALVEADGTLAERVVQEEDAINQMQMEIDESVVRVLALHQLMAVDLRFVLAVSRINADLERIGDQAVNIAESVLRIAKYPQVKPYIDLPRMSQIAEDMVRDSLNALVSGDQELARSVLQRDDTVDALRDQILRELLTYMMGNATVVIPSFQLISIAQNLERVADHATNIAEDVIYVVAGQDVRHGALDRS
jgi:phosphate transport system protein